MNYSLVESNFSKIDLKFFQKDYKKEELDRLIMGLDKDKDKIITFSEGIERFSKLLCKVFCNNCLFTKTQLENMNKYVSIAYMSEKMDEIHEIESVPSFVNNVVNY